MTSSRQKFYDYVRTGCGEVSGASNVLNFFPLHVLSQYQSEHDISGSVGEIGVHHGKFFIGLHNLKDEGKRSLAIDVFDLQHLNIDGSGHGNKKAFLENVAQHAQDPDDVDILMADSISVSDDDIQRIHNDFGRFKLFSVDGGHTAVHTANDLAIAEKLLANGGVLILDDLFNMNWPGVHEGTARFFQSPERKLAPFLIVTNKVFFTTFSYQKEFYQLMHSTFGKVRNAKVRTETMYGFPTVILHLTKLDINEKKGVIVSR